MGTHSEDILGNPKILRNHGPGRGGGFFLKVKGRKIQVSEVF